MNLRKSRFSSRQKKDSSYKDINFPVKKIRNLAKRKEKVMCLDKSLSKTPVKYQNSIIDDIFTLKSPCINLVTSTPISQEVKKRILRSSDKHDSDKIAKQNLVNKISKPVTPSPIQKISCKPCEVRVTPVRLSKLKYLNERKSHQILKSNQASSNNRSLNSKALSENKRSTRNKILLSKDISDDIEISLSQESNAERENFKIPEKHSKNNKKSISPKREIKVRNKKKSSQIRGKDKRKCVTKNSTPKSKSLVFGKSNKISKIKKTYDSEVSQTTSDSLFQTDNSNSSRHSLRKSSVLQTKSNNGTETTKTSRHSLRLKNQQLSKKASYSVLPSKSSLLSQDITKTPKSVLGSSSNKAKNPSRLELKRHSSQKLVSQHSSKKISTKKQKSTKEVRQNKTSVKRKKSSISSKKEKSLRTTVDKCQRKCLSFTENIPVDDLALSKDRRKVKSEGFKLPGKNTLKRKKSAIQAIMNADEDYQDDIYESKEFDQFKDLLMDTSDSDQSYSMATPTFPVTPVFCNKTPKYKDIFTPNGYAASRKAAMEYIYRNKRRKCGQPPLPETPVIKEKKLEYSKALEDVQKIKKTIDSLEEEESDNDSYFSF